MKEARKFLELIFQKYYAIYFWAFVRGISGSDLSVVADIFYLLLVNERYGNMII